MNQHFLVEIAHLNILLPPFSSTCTMLVYFMHFFRRSDSINHNKLLKYDGDGGHTRVGSSFSMKLVPS